MRTFFGVPRITAGFLVVLVGYSSAAAIVFQAAKSVGANEAEIGSWMWALGIGMGLSTIGLSLRFRQPILTAWSTPGAAVLVTSLAGVSISQAVGAFLFSSVLIMICGFSGWFERIMAQVPKSIASAMLAGVLFQFGLQLFTAFESQALLAGLMLGIYIIVKHHLARYVIPLALVVGLVASYMMDLIKTDSLVADLSLPVWISPSFSLASLIGVGIPLFVVTMASQNIPGLAVLRANGYNAPASPLIGWTGFTGVLLAPFGGYAFNLAAITAAICMTPEADADPAKRYLAAVWAGIFYLLMGLMGASVVGLFIALPVEFVMVIAGLALLGTIGNSLAGAMAEEEEREAALITLLVTVSGISALGVGSAFWGLVVGLLFFHKQRFFRRQQVEGD